MWYLSNYYLDMWILYNTFVKQIRSTHLADGQKKSGTGTALFFANCKSTHFALD